MELLMGTFRGEIRQAMRPNHPNLRWKACIDASHPGDVRTIDVSIQVDNLCPRVDASVGAACAHHSQWRHEKPCNRRFQMVLYAATRGLRLPTTIRGATIFKTKYNAHSRSPKKQRARRSAPLRTIEQFTAQRESFSLLAAVLPNLRGPLR